MAAGDYHSRHTGPVIDNAVDRIVNTPGDGALVSSFNGRTGDVTPQAGDYTAEMVGAAPAVESADHPGCYYQAMDGATEWLNPPMVLGVEYRTTERYLGRPVYTRAVQVDMPAAGGQTYASFGDATYRGISVTGRTDDDRSRAIAGTDPTTNPASKFMAFFHTGSSAFTVGVYSESVDFTAQTAVLTVKYFKTTD